MENVGKRTPSDPMKTGCRGKNPSECCESVGVGDGSQLQELILTSSIRESGIIYILNNYSTRARWI